MRRKKNEKDMAAFELVQYAQKQVERQLIDEILQWKHEQQELN